MSFETVKKCSQGGVVVAIDLDNLLISSLDESEEVEGFSIEAGFEQMFEWIRTFGKTILCVYFYLPRTQRLTNEALLHNLWEKYKDKFIIEAVFCPKRKPVGPLQKEDNVDNHLIVHTEKVINFLGDRVEYFCLASGDIDYSPFLHRLKREKKIKLAFVIGSERSFSAMYRQMKIIAKHPATNEELVHHFSPYQPHKSK